MTSDTNPSRAQIAKEALAAVGGQRLDLAALQSLVPEFPEFYGKRPIAFDLDRREVFNPEARAEEDATQGLLYVWPHASDTLVVLFRGIGRKGGALPKRRWGALFNAGVHVLVLNDRTRCFYGKGIELFGRGSGPTLDFIRQLQKALGCTRLYTCGSSAGGSGAINYGAQLNAEKILAFSPVTAINSAFYDARDTQAPDSERVLKRLQRFQRAMRPAERFDSRAVLEAAQPSSRIRVHYPTGLYWDRMWGENLKGLPQVELIAHDGVSEHSLLNDTDEQTIAASEVQQFFLEQAEARAPQLEASTVTSS